MFERLGFVVVNRVAVFQEVEMRLGLPVRGVRDGDGDGNGAQVASEGVGHERWCKGEMVVFE